MEATPLPEWASWLIAILFFGTLFTVAFILYQRKVSGLEAFAKKHGLVYDEAAPPTLDVPLGSILWRLTEKGAEARHMVRGERDGVELRICDLHFVRESMAGRRHMHAYPTTVVRMESKDLELPAFTARPETLLQKIAITIGGKDIDIPSHSKFSRKFRLTADDEHAVRALFSIDIMDAISRMPGSVVEGEGSVIVYWRPRKRIPPRRLINHLNEALNICSAFRGQ